MLKLGDNCLDSIDRYTVSILSDKHHTSLWRCIWHNFPWSKHIFHQCFSFLTVWILTLEYIANTFRVLVGSHSLNRKGRRSDAFPIQSNRFIRLWFLMNLLMNIQSHSVLRKSIVHWLKCILKNILNRTLQLMWRLNKLKRMLECTFFLLPCGRMGCILYKDRWNLSIQNSSPFSSHNFHLLKCIHLCMIWFFHSSHTERFFRCKVQLLEGLWSNLEK